jgi:glycosyltransferase involved in cell wall biosynthesis
VRVRVLRVHHGGRDSGARHRERALVARGIDVTLVVPRAGTSERPGVRTTEEPFRIVELDAERVDDPLRHRYRDPAAIRAVIDLVRPDVLDVHEEPSSAAARQWLTAAGNLPVALYAEENLDRRLSPVHTRREREVLRRADALYPCTRQAAAVARGRGFAGQIEVLPLGVDDRTFSTGRQSLNSTQIVLGMVGRFTPDQGLLDGVRVLAEVRRVRPVRLLVVGDGPELPAARALAAELGVADALDVAGWCSVDRLAELYRQMHVVLVPRRGSPDRVVRFPQVVPEALASGAVVAGYDSGAVPEIAGRAGVIVPEGEFRALARTVTRLVTDPEEHARRRSAGAAMVLSQTWAEVTRRQTSLYRGILSGAHDRLPVVRSAARRRELARVEFGPPACPVPGRVGTPGCGTARWWWMGSAGRAPAAEVGGAITVLQ